LQHISSIGCPHVSFFKTPLEILSPPLSSSKGISPKVLGCLFFGKHFFS